MRTLKFSTLALAAALALGTSAFAAAPHQDGAKQDMKAAGHDTKEAAVNTGRGVKTGTKKAYHGTKRGVKKAYHKTAKVFHPHTDSQAPNHR